MAGLPPWLLAPILLGALLALAGGYWDDAWHTERGRDEFLSAPHVLIYGGVALAGAALALWVLRDARSRGLRAALAQRSLALALLAVAVTLASGPIDNAWHVAFGRDAVIWSPPHTLGIVGTGALGVAVLVELSSSTAAWARRLAPIVGGLVLAAFSFLVVEYETDVPQFDVLWYLPVLSVASVFALSIVRLATPDSWAATQAAAVHFAFIAGVALFLLALGYDAPKLPLLVGPALVLDLASRRGLAAPVAALGYVGALYLLYVPTLEWLGEGVTLDEADAVVGFVVSVAATLLAMFLVLGPRLRASRSAATVAGVLFVLLAGPGAAQAHDPGQGDEAGAMRLFARTDGRAVELAATPLNGCEGITRAEVVARRAGETLRAPLERRGCRFRGRLTVAEEGRWFVYAALRRGRVTVESWLPVEVGGARAAVADPRRYAYVAEDAAGGAGKAAAGAGLYLGMLGMLTAIVVLVRRERGRPHPV